MTASVTRGRALRYAEGSARGLLHHHQGHCPCNGNSGPLAEDITQAIKEDGLCTFAVLSGNRNFEGRIHPLITGAYLASPPLVVAAALAGSVARDLGTEALGIAPDGRPVFLRDIWPESDEVAAHVRRFVTAEMFQRSYAQNMETSEEWAALEAPDGPRFPWQTDSLFIQQSPFPGLGPALDPDQPLRGARALLVLGDSITTDHISPNGAIRPDSQAGQALTAAGADPAKLGNYGARRGNPAICLRGMFDNPLLRNELVPERRGNLAWSPDGGLVSVFEAAEAYRTAGTSLVIVAGRNYGSGSSRDWAAKGLRLLGVQAVIAESFERIHRANLVGMGVLPIMLPLGTTRHDLAIGLRDRIDIALPEGPTVRAPVSLTVWHQDGSTVMVVASLAITAESEIEMIRRGGILPAFLKRT